MGRSLRFDEVLGEIRPVLDGIRDEDISTVAQILADAPRVFVAGAGRSGLIVRAFAMRLAQAGLDVYVVGGCTTPAIKADDALFIVSGSGKTSTTRAIAECAKNVEARVLLATYTTKSPIATMADAVLEIPVPVDPNRPGGLAGTQALGTLFDQCLFLTCDVLAEAVAGIRGIGHDEMKNRHANLE